jgi:hypothetical protein
MISAPITANAGFVGLRNREGTSGSGYSSVVDEPIHISEGSPLDITALRTTAVPAGNRGRVRVALSDQRKLEETSAPGTFVRFHIATWQPEDSLHPLPSSHAEIDEGVRSLAAQGYNALRIQGIEYILQNGQTGSLVFRQNKLDDFDYLLYALKKAGIYWIFQPFSYTLYRDPMGNSLWWANGSYAQEKPKLFIQQESRDHWLLGFNAIYNRVNPYTGLNMLQDPALVLVSAMNENSAIFAAVTPSIPGFPWQARDSGKAQGTAGQTFPEWLADSSAAHGYANLAALNTAWGTAHASFTLAAASQSTKLSTSSNTVREIDATLYCRYLDANLAAWYRTTLLSIGCTALIAPLVSFPIPYYLGHENASGQNDVHAFHQYAGTSNNPGIGISIGTLGQVGLWDRAFFLATQWGYDTGKPLWADEIGFPYWARARNQYPICAAYGALNGASAFTWYAQGSIFTPIYNTNSPARVRVVYPYDGTSQVEQFGMLVSFFAFSKGYVIEGATAAKTLVCNPKYVGWLPKVGGRLNRSLADFYNHSSKLPSYVKARFQWNEAATDDTWAVTHNSKSLFTWLDELKVAGYMTADNLAYVSAAANNGAMVGFDISVPGLPVMQVASHTLVTGDYVSIMSLTGSGSNWPGTIVQTSIYQVTVNDATHLAINGLNASTWTGTFTAGTWCESNNVVQSGNKEIGFSRRHKYCLIDTTKLKFIGIGATPTLPTITGLTVNSLTDYAALAVISLDGLSIATSDHLLIGLVGEDQNTGTTWDGNRDVMSAVGDYPIQITDCTANITLTVANAREMQLYRLQRNGSRSSRETPNSINAVTGEITLNLRTGSIYPSIWFELIRKM